MKCPKCGEQLVEARATVDTPYRYVTSGLKNIYLVGIVLRRCKRCNSENAVVPRMADLHRAIARVLLDKPERLNGDELRFLRKHAGLSALDFAAQLQIEPETLSRFENDKQDLGVTTEKLARAIVKAEIQSAEKAGLRDFLLRKQRLRTATAGQPSLFSFCRSHWKKAA